MDKELIEQTISAAMDGEAVDLELLRQALRTPPGRDALAAFVLLRAACASDAASLETRAVPPTVAAASRQKFTLRTVSRYRVPAALAASLAALAVAGAFWLGSAWQAPQVTVQLTPPAAARPAVGAAHAPVVVLPAVVRPCAPPPAPQPPQPTRVVRYVRGVDWTDVTSQ